MEMLVLPDIKTRGNGQIGKKGCRQKKEMLGKLADIDVLAQHVADMLPIFPTKALLEIKFPMLISVESKLATYHHVVVVWREMVFDLNLCIRIP